MALTDFLSMASVQMQTAKVGSKTPFVSKSFDEKDEYEVNGYFEKILEALGISYRTAESYDENPIYEKVEKLICDSDLLIGIYVVRYEDIMFRQSSDKSMANPGGLVCQRAGKGFYSASRKGRDRYCQL